MLLNVNLLFKRLPLIVLTLAVGFHSVLAADSCLEMFRIDTSPLVQFESPQTSEVTLAPEIAQHVLRGDFAPDGRLDGGMHTEVGLIRLFELNTGLHFESSTTLSPHLLQRLRTVFDRFPRTGASSEKRVLIRELQNGVVLVQMPRSGFTNKVQLEQIKYGQTREDIAHLKTLFPSHWTDQFILQTIKNIVSSATPTEVASKNIVREIQGVSVLVRLNEVGKVVSAYPTFEQAQIKAEIELYQKKMKDVIGQTFAKDVAMEIKKTLEKFLDTEIQESGLAFSRNWFFIISPRLRERVVDKFIRAWLIKKPIVILLGFRDGFENSPDVLNSLKGNFGALSFRNRLDQLRPGLRTVDAEQVAYRLLTSFGVTNFTHSEVQNVRSMLLDSQADFSLSLYYKLNESAFRSLIRYHTHMHELDAQLINLEYDVAHNLDALLFSDLRQNQSLFLRE